MKKELLTPRQYKVNLHAHTSISDGALSPQEVKAYYRAHGYSAVAFTDHEVLVPHDDLTDGDFVALHGYEYDIGRTERGGARYHFNLICRTPSMRAQVLFRPEAVTGNARNYIPLVSYIGDYAQSEYSVDYANRLIRKAHEAGFLVQYNHPVWSLHSYPDYAPLEGVDLLEVFNYGSSISSLIERDDRVLQDMLRLGKFPMPTGGDDNHNGGYAHPVPPTSTYDDSFGAFTMLCAQSLTYDALISALERGDGYASEGPIIRTLYAEDGVLYGEVSGARLLRAQGTERLGRTLLSGKGDLLTRFAIPFTRDWQYVRLIVEDACGRRAYTRAYQMSEVL